MSKAAKGRALMKSIQEVARQGGRSVNELRVVIALERIVARLENNPKLAKHLVFKGGFVLLKLIDSARFTRDVDALAKGISRAEIPDLVKSAIETDLQDGLWYGDLKSEEMIHQGTYEGIRFDCAFQIGDPPAPSKLRKLSRIHVDIGFGDKIPEPQRHQMKSVSPGTEPVSWLVYPIEYILAEKLHSLYDRGSANSRAKDVFDLVLILPRCGDPQKALDAVRATFAQRNSAPPASFVEAAKGLNLSIMEGAWPGVQIDDKRLAFSDVWAQLLRHLAQLDGLRAG